jgi:hypothetical protein
MGCGSQAWTRDLGILKKSLPVVRYGSGYSLSIVGFDAAQCGGRRTGSLCPRAFAVSRAVPAHRQLLTTLLFGLIFKVLPDVRVPWKDIWIGAALTAALFTLGKFLIGLYLGKAAVGSTYGAAGSLLVVLICIYYSAQILFFGAEFTQVYANRLGFAVQPEDHAQFDSETKVKIANDPS